MIFCWYFQTFSELIEAASKDDQHSVDQYSNELAKGVDAVAGEKSMYTAYADDTEMTPVLSFCFGKAAGSELGKDYIDQYYY